jgi:hypothetical protein
MSETRAGRHFLCFANPSHPQAEQAKSNSLQEFDQV